MYLVTPPAASLLTALLISGLLVSGCSNSGSDSTNASEVAGDAVGIEEINESSVVDAIAVDSDGLVDAVDSNLAEVTPEDQEEDASNLVENEVISPTVVPEAVQASLELIADKTFRISWPLMDGADFYRILENPDGVSGFTQVGLDLDASVQTFDHRVALYKRVDARYIVQACNAAGCTDSEEQFVVGSLEGAIGYLKSSNSETEDRFGTSISMSADGTVLAVGAPSDDSRATGVNGNENDNSKRDSGAVYVFVLENGNWQQNAFLKASNTDERDGFGRTVSLSADGSTLAVGTRGEGSGSLGINGEQNDVSAPISGAVYLFVRTNDSWQQQAYVKASNTDQSDQFGEAVSLSANGDTLAVGAIGEDSAASGVNGSQVNDSGGGFSYGAAYVFVRTDESWEQQAYLKASNPGLNDFFGHAVSLSADGNTLAVGASQEDSASTGVNGNQTNNGAPTSGAVYVYARINGNWRQQAYVKSSNPTSDGVDQFGGRDFFGSELSLSADGNTLAVGAYGEDSAAQGIDGDQLDNTGFGFGAVYVFVRSEGVWQQQEYIKASNSFEGDFFGRSVSLSANGDFLAVGAYGEDSVATGVNGDQNLDFAGFAGAVYLFERASGQWRQQAYLKSGNPDPSDHFGWSVSLSAQGDTLAVGASGESSVATGINGNQSDNSALNAGAVYLY